MTEVLKYASRVDLMATLAKVVATDLRKALETGPATLAVPGGTTPGPFFAELRQVDLDWARVRVLLTDERFVPETSDRSNTRLLRETLLQDHAAAANLVPLVAEAAAPEDVLDGLAQGVTDALPLTVCVLGMGADMHTASLFPGADLLAEALAPDAPTLLPMRAPGAPEPRITLSAPALRGAGAIHILITGDEKLRALDTARESGPIEAAPVRAILDRATVHWAE